MLLIRTDMDALPVTERTGLPYASTARDIAWSGEESGVMHACGHDIHMTVWLGVARELAARKSEWKGTAVMIGQPAEEIGLGAMAMLEDGLFKRFPKPNFNLALHDNASLPAGTIGVCPIPCLRQKAVNAAYDNVAPSATSSSWTRTRFPLHRGNNARICSR